MKKYLILSVALCCFGVASAQATDSSKTRTSATMSANKSEKKKKAGKSGKNDPNAKGSGVVTDAKDAPKLDTIATTARPRRSD